ncbi:MAG: hypothetical protein ACI9VM_000140 [Candidatus Azotimanducaceae bacterium]|jgi:hypothetical protein
MKNMPTIWQRNAEGKRPHKPPYGRENGSKVLSEEERRAGYRVEHRCSVGFPDCIDPRIYTGDWYLRKVTLFWSCRPDGTFNRYVCVEKVHCSCPHDYHQNEDEDDFVDSETEASSAAA